MTRAFTRTDALAVAAILALLAALIPPFIVHARDENAKAKCTDNLTSIMKAMVIYSAEQTGDSYPYVAGTKPDTYESALKPNVGSDTADKTIAGIYEKNLFPNDPFAPLWILVLRNETATKTFLCPEDPTANKAAELQKDKNYYQNFQDSRNISYSIAFMWQGEENKIVPAAFWRTTSDSSYILLSDMAPYLSSKAKDGETHDNKKGDDAAKTATSPNHKYTGMNVAFADAHSEWIKRPDMGFSNDNIWTITVDKKELAIDAGKLPGKLTANQPPFDIVMVPTRTAKGDLK
jgi:hypothetical protein